MLAIATVLPVAGSVKTDCFCSSRPTDRAFMMRIDSAVSWPSPSTG